jgi:hypothetical protein
MKLIPVHSDIFILQRSKSTELEIPDSAMSVGAYRGKIVAAHKEKFVEGRFYSGQISPYSHVEHEKKNKLEGKEVFFDASKAFRLSTSDGEFYAVRHEHILVEIDDGQ